MDRVILIDNIRGFAFILMLIHHIYYLKNKYSINIIVEICGIIARYLFILLVGISLVFSYNKNSNNFISKCINKSIKILIHSLFITLLTYYYYPNSYIRFGILHFIGISTLLLIPIVPYKNLYIILLIFLILLNNIKIPKFNNYIDDILGHNYTNHEMLDWFGLIDWMPIIVLGMIIGNNYSSIEKIISLFNINISLINNYNMLTWLGQNSLELYTLHVYILVILYNHIL